jgi:mono/diheme cytochrome c family protein
MRFISLVLLFAWLTTSTIDRIASAQDDESQTGDVNYSAAAFGTCSACHLADGAGIPGAFPPLRNRVTAIASLEGGREYLATVVSFGLMGMIEVGGMQYFGVMAGNSGAMTADEIAAALNYAVFELTDDKDAASSVPAFSAEEVSRSQSRATAASPAVAGKLREKMLEQHADQWPK